MSPNTSKIDVSDGIPEETTENSDPMIDPAIVMEKLLDEKRIKKLALKTGFPEEALRSTLQMSAGLGMVGLGALKDKIVENFFPDKSNEKYINEMKKYFGKWIMDMLSDDDMLDKFGEIRMSGISGLLNGGDDAVEVELPPDVLPEDVFDDTRPETYEQVIQEVERPPVQQQPRHPMHDVIMKDQMERERMIGESMANAYAQFGTPMGGDINPLAMAAMKERQEKERLIEESMASAEGRAPDPSITGGAAHGSPKGIKKSKATNRAFGNLRNIQDQTAGEKEAVIDKFASSAELPEEGDVENPNSDIFEEPEFEDDYTGGEQDTMDTMDDMDEMMADEPKKDVSKFINVGGED